MRKIVDALIAVTTRPPLQVAASTQPSMDYTAGELEFVAMEYFGLILNRTFLIKATYKGIFGIKAHGPMPAPRVVTESMYYPEFYVPERDRTFLRPKLDDMDGKSVGGDDQFCYPWSKVNQVSFNTLAKWGMGTIPYSGRIVLGCLEGKAREFILLGRQDGVLIQTRIEALRIAR